MTEAPAGKRPSIRRRVFGAVASAFLLLFVALCLILYIGAQRLLLAREHADIRSQAQMSQGLLHASVEHLPALSLDISLSLGANNHLSGGVAAFDSLPQSFSPNAHRLDFIALLDVDGGVLRERSDPGKASSSQLASLYARIAPEALRGDGCYGFFSHNGQVFYTSAHPVPGPGKDGSAAGLLLLGRAIDSDELMYISRSAAFAFDIEPIDAAGLSPQQRAQLDQAGGIVVRNGKTITAYEAVAAADGGSKLLIKTERPRTLYWQSMGYMAAILLAAATFCAVAAAAAIAWLNRIAINPVTQLAADIGGGDMAETNVSAQSHSSQEIASLSTAINSMALQIRVSREIIEKKDRELLYLANFDALSGLRNRRSTVALLEECIEWARAQDKPVCVFFIDLDRFKYINDSLGHDAGDRFIQLLADRMRECFQQNAFIGRMGVDEFVIIARNIETEEARKVYSERIIEAFAKPFTIRRRQIQVGLSVGASAYPEDGLDAEALIKNAEIAMFRAKENGDGMYVPYQGEMHAVMKARVDTETKLRRAISEGFSEFRVFFQPKLNVSTGEIAGGEALLRWVTPDNIALPLEFIPQAEASGLIIPLSWWMIHECCRMSKEFERYGFLGTISINIPAQVLFHKNFLPIICGAAHEAGTDFSRLDIEIVESVLVEDFEKVNEVLHKLHELGMQVSVDDFGTGYSSLSYLSKMAIDRLKIDRSFVSRIGMTNEDRTIVDAIIAMAKRLKLIITAEGVEDETQYTFLKNAQCDEVQGYLISRPLSADEFIRFVIRQRGVQLRSHVASGK